MKASTGPGLVKKGAKQAIEGALPLTAGISGRAARVFWPAVIVWLLAASVPKLPRPLLTGVDAAWQYALNLTRLDGLRIGPDIAFTMGPLGYLTAPDPDLTPWVQPFLLRLLGWLVLVWSVWRLSRLWPSRAVASAAFSLCSIHLLHVYYPDAWQASYVAMFAAVAASPSMMAIAAAGAVAGFTLLLKANEAVLAGVLYGLLVLHSRRVLSRHWPWFLCIPAGVLLAGCEAVNGGAWTAVPYMAWALEVVRGFTEAASTEGPAWHTGLFLLTAAMLLGMPLREGGASCLRSPLWWCAAAQAFMSFKHGFVRQDVHADLAILKLSLAGLFLLPLLAQARKGLAILMALSAAFTWIHLSEARPKAFQPAMKAVMPGGLASSIANLFSYPEGYARIGEVSRESRKELLLGEPWRERIQSGTVDAFPDQVDWIRANGWRYRARPTIDALTAFTRRLSERNRAHLDGKTAPDFMLYFHEAIDARHPLLQDTGALKAILEWYEPVYGDSRALLLERQRAPRRMTFRDAGSATAGWEQPLEIPRLNSDETLWASFGIRPTLFGRLRWFLFRTNPAILDVADAEGNIRWYLLIRDYAEAPLPFHPLPRNLDEAAAFFRGDPGRNWAPPVRVVVRNLGPREYGGEVRVRWYAVRRPAPRGEP